MYIIGSVTNGGKTIDLFPKSDYKEEEDTHILI